MGFTCPVCREGSIPVAEVKRGNEQCDFCGIMFVIHKGNYQLVSSKKPNQTEYIPMWDFIRRRGFSSLPPEDWENISSGGFLDSETGSINDLKKERDKIIFSQKILISTTSNIDGHSIKEYKGVSGSQVMAGINMFKDVFAGFRNVVGGRSRKLQESMNEMRKQAIHELREEAFQLKANAVVGVKLDFDEYAENMLMLSISGTAVVIEYDRN